jgi:ribosome biogenesis protein MAK21
VFFHKYFNQKAVSAPKKTKKEKASADDEDEDEVWRAMMSSIPGGLDNEDEDEEGLEDDEEDDEDDEAMRALLMEDEDEDEVEGDFGEDMAEFGSDEEGDHMDNLELMNASSMDEEEFENQTNKRPVDSEDEEAGLSNRQKKKQKKEKERLPTFASYEDYAKLIEQDLSADE